MTGLAHDRKRRVLLVDDDSAIRFTLAALLRDMGCEVSEAEDAARALDLIRTQGFDLVVTDFAMEPGASGVELIRSVLADSQSAVPVMILFTAHALDTGAIRELRAEVHGRHPVYFVKKGTSLNELEAVLDTALTIGRRQKS